jgi:bleomycin hydrolase
MFREEMQRIKDEKAAKDSLLSKPIQNKVITQEYRQQEFDNYNTQDDHGMHITGMGEDENGNKYYIVKNSWGETNDAKGFLYASESYVLLKTIDIMVHKDAIPQSIKRKLINFK